MDSFIAPLTRRPNQPRFKSSKWQLIGKSLPVVLQRCQPSIARANEQLDPRQQLTSFRNDIIGPIYRQG